LGVFLFLTFSIKYDVLRKNFEFARKGFERMGCRMVAATTPMVLTIFLVLVAGVAMWFKPRFRRFRFVRARRIRALIVRRLHLVLFAKWYDTAPVWGFDWELSRFLREVKRARKVGCSSEEVNGVLNELVRRWPIFPELEEIHQQGGLEALERHVEYLKIS
jgi:hypothetical protein